MNLSPGIFSEFKAQPLESPRWTMSSLSAVTSWIAAYSDRDDGDYNADDNASDDDDDASAEDRSQGGGEVADSSTQVLASLIPSFFIIIIITRPMVIVMVLLLILATFPHINKCSGSKKLPRGDQVLLTTFLVISIIAGWYLPQLSSLHCQRCIAGWYLHCHNCHRWTGRAIGQSCHQSWYLPLFPTLPRLNRKHAVNEEPQRDIGSLEQFFVHCLCLFVRLPARSMVARSIRWVVHCHTPLFLFLFQLSSLHRPPHSSTAHHPRNELSTKKLHYTLFHDGYVHVHCTGHWTAKTILNATGTAHNSDGNWRQPEINTWLILLLNCSQVSTTTGGREKVGAKSTHQGPTWLDPPWVSAFRASSTSPGPPCKQSTLPPWPLPIPGTW